MYESQVTFTFDVVCPWTYIAKQRLDEALLQVRSGPHANIISYNIHFASYQLFPNFPATADKQAWYLSNMHNNNPDAQKLYQAHMNDLASTVGKKINFEGSMGNTFNAHRVLQYFQEEKGTETADRLVDAMYKRYFNEAKDPADADGLVQSCVEAGIGEEEARRVVEDESEGRIDVRNKMREAALDVDAVPVVVVEGKRRDITLTGLKEVAEYAKAMDQVAKECI